MIETNSLKFYKCSLDSQQRTVAGSGLLVAILNNDAKNESGLALLPCRFKLSASQSVDEIYKRGVSATMTNTY